MSVCHAESADRGRVGRWRCKSRWRSLSGIGDGMSAERDAPQRGCHWSWPREGAWRAAAITIDPRFPIRAPSPSYVGLNWGDSSDARRRRAGAMAAEDLSPFSVYRGNDAVHPTVPRTLIAPPQTGVRTRRSQVRRQHGNGRVRQ
jgi:hypothetical protein